MKRRTHPEPTKGHSPYTRYAKLPYQYPSWARADIKGGYTPAEVLKACKAHLSSRAHKPTEPTRNQLDRS